VTSHSGRQVSRRRAVRSPRLGRAAAVGLGLALAACGTDTEAPPPSTSPGTASPGDGNFEAREYERNFVFASMEGDSVFIVSWMMKNVETPDSIEREAHAWLARGGVWDGFYAERWATPPTREPSLLLPYRGLTLLVREGDAIDGVVFEEGPRSLEIIMEEVGASWTGARGGSFEVLTGAAYLSDQRIDGMVLDMARASVGGTPTGGDWAFLLSGDSAQFVLSADVEHGGEVEPLYRGWGDLGENELVWPEVRVDWRRTEAFPPARRDVPVEWRVWSSDGSVEGELEAVSAEIRAGDGPGPLLPVRALYDVVGELRSAEGPFPVRGILVHERR
jgi:hypothetical protein